MLNKYDVFINNNLTRYVRKYPFHTVYWSDVLCNFFTCLDMIEYENDEEKPEVFLEFF